MPDEHATGAGRGAEGGAVRRRHSLTLLAALALAGCQEPKRCWLVSFGVSKGTVEVGAGVAVLWTKGKGMPGYSFIQRQIQENATRQGYEAATPRSVSEIGCEPDDTPGVKP